MKRIVLKINIDGSIEPFTSLRKLFDKYPEIEKYSDSIEHYLSRLKADYVSELYSIRRCIVNET
jgi:hypothetical protein